ncbi:MAG: FAD:protein FMN transferase [Candidatus Omnitrophica bacterium]|nr:FAD:protein FMN transferase [Candidatus Omnitrophota bacterium]
MFLILLVGCSSQPLYKDTQVMMGTFVEVISPDKEAAAIVFNEVKRIEKLLSKYDPESEISQLNKFGKLKVSPETFFVLSKSCLFWKQTNGAFDVTVGPLLDVWGFTDKNYKLPDKSKIKEALRSVGSDKIVLNEVDSVVEFNSPGVKVDLGAIAKGFAVDCAVEKLKEAGIKSCLVNAGGQIYCLGKRFGKPWRVVIQNPRGPGSKGSFDLIDQAVATSGDYESYFEVSGKRYMHIFDPRTGYPADNEVMCVTVIAPDGLTADALATAMMVMGKEKSDSLIKQYPGVIVRIVEKNA